MSRITCLLCKGLRVNYLFHIFLASKVANLPVFIGIYLITLRYRFGYSIHIPKAKEYRYFHGKLGCEVHLLRPPLISHQVSSSCGLVGKDILTSIRNNPRMLHDENELTKIIEWATSKQRLLEKVTSAFYCLQFFFLLWYFWNLVVFWLLWYF